MKKHLIVGSLFLYVVLSCYMVNSFLFKTQTASIESSPIYAKVLTNASLKKSPTKSNDTLNVYFVLEESYYVKILNEENDFYYVEYLDLKGYISKEKVKLVNENINNPYLTNITFDIIKETNLYSSPNFSDDNIKTKIGVKEKVFYYGKIYSHSLVENSSNVWYYCKIEENNTKITGYIHSSFCNNLSPIVQNKEISTEFISNSQANNLLHLNIKTEVIIVCVISVPILFILFLFLKGFKKI